MGSLHRKDKKVDSLKIVSLAIKLQHLAHQADSRSECPCSQEILQCGSTNTEPIVSTVGIVDRVHASQGGEGEADIGARDLCANETEAKDQKEEYDPLSRGRATEDTEYRVCCCTCRCTDKESPKHLFGRTTDCQVGSPKDLRISYV